MNAPPLDHFRPCEVPDCPWQVLEPATRCHPHGGPDGPQYAEAEDGTLLDARHLDLLTGEDD